ncbi:MAG: class I SAM-dependent methyltransferase [Patescibacteria group bacterium]
MAFVLPEEIIKNLFLNEGMHVADFGAGTGAFSIAAGKLIGSGHVYAIEVVSDLLPKIKSDAAARGVFNVEVIRGDIETVGGTTLSAKSVDRVIISNVLFQAEDKEGVAKEAARVLKPNGLALVVDWSASYGGLGPADKDVFPKDKAVALFLNNGFALANEISAGDFHYGFVVRRL